MSDLTKWPTFADVQARLLHTGVTLPNDFDSSTVQQIINSVGEATEKECLRTFVPVTETRYFDGTGRSELEIDEYITITAVNIIGYFGNVAGLSLTNWREPQRNKMPKNRIYVFQGSTPGLSRIWLANFPMGNDNISISATWGYGSTIPADLWEAVLGAVCSTVLAESMYNGGKGFTNMWKEADVMEQLSLLDPQKFLPYTSRYKDAISRYRKPAARRIRDVLRKQME